MRSGHGILSLLLAPMICLGGDMGPKIVTKSAFYFIGIEVRTNNRDEMSDKGKIGPLWRRFYADNILSKIPGKRGDAVLAIYTDYESDVNGEYSFVIGSAVDSLAQIPAGFVGGEIPAAKYAVYSSARGAIPGVIIDVWRRIWNDQTIVRAYASDFEVYGPDAADPQNAQVDVYVSVK